MEYGPCISQIATLLADPKRSAMIWALMDGTARPADELAILAGLSTSSAGAHLARLTSGGLLKQEVRGRKRFFRLAAPEVGAAVEALACASLASAEQINRRFAQPAPPLPLRRARVCSDHLGGEMAAELYQRLLEAGWIEQQEKRVEVTSKGWPDLPNAVSTFPHWRNASAKRSVSVRNGTTATRTWAARWGRGCCSFSFRWAGCAPLKSPAPCRFHPVGSGKSARSQRRPDGSGRCGALHH